MKIIIIPTLLLGLFLVGCTPTHPNVFQNPICKPPCWENITPGATIKADAQAILSKDSHIDQPIQISTQPVGAYDTVLYSTLNKDISAWIKLYIYNDHVYMMRFSYNLNLTLSDAIDLFGDPEWVQVNQSGETDYMVFISPNSGVVFAFQFPLSKSSVLKPTTKVDEVDFFDPAQLKWYIANNLQPYAVDQNGKIKNGFPWKGYGNISTLYLSP